MQNFNLLLMIIFLTACSEKSTNNSIKDQHNKVGQTSATSQMLKDLQENNLQFMNALKTATRSSEVREPYATINNIEDGDINILPYYHFNRDSFYINPSPEKILTCLSQPQDEIWFVGLNKTNNHSYKISARQKDGHWSMQELTMDWWNLIDWLPAKLQEANTNEYKLFMVSGQEYIVYLKENQPVFRDIFGNEIPPYQFCETLIALIKQGKDMEEHLQNKITSH